MAAIDLTANLQCQADMRGDPQFVNVLLLLQCAGASGTTTFVDQSASPAAFSTFGNAKVDSTDHKFLGGSLLFDGAADYLTSTSAKFAFGTNPTTVEFFFKAAALAQAFHIIFDTRPVGGNDGILIWVNASGQLRAYANGNAVNSDSSRDVYTAAGAVVVDTWYHCTLTVTSSQMVLYLNAATSGNMSVSRTITALSGTTLNIGQTREGGNNFSGRLERLRVSNVVRTVAVPTAPYAIGDFTPKLTASVKLDAALRARADMQGDPLANAVKVLLYGDGVIGSTTVVDSSISPKPIVNGGVTIDPDFVNGGGALRFVGALNSYITIGAGGSAGLAIGAGDFEVSFWIKTSVDLSGGAVFPRVLCPATTANPASGALQVWISGSTAFGSPAANVVEIPTSNGLGVKVSTVSPVNDGKWHFIQFIRASGTLSAYFDGVLKSTATDSEDYTYPASEGFKLGSRSDATSATQCFNGLLDDFRLTGAARVPELPVGPPASRSFAPTLTVVPGTVAAMAAAATLSGALTTSIRANAALTGASALSGALTAAIRATAGLAATSTFSGALTASSGMSSALAGSATLTGTLTAGVRLAAAISSLSALSGALSAGIRFASALGATSALTGALSVGRGGFSCALAVSSNLSGELIAPTFSGGPYMVVDAEALVATVPVDDTVMTVA